MKKAGIREARQYFSVLLEEVKKGNEVLITDRGKPVARLAPCRETALRPLPDLAEFRSSMPRLDPPLSDEVALERADRG